MIPKFPEFKKLEIFDKADIEKLTSRYEPYSDFSFIDMWSWDAENRVELSELNQNLLIKTSDYFGKFSYSYLGNNRVDDTVENLFALMKDEKVRKPELILIPEVSLSGLDTNKYYIEIDLNNYDYIYNIEELSVYTGNKFQDKRRKLNTFLHNHNNPTVKLIDVSNDVVKKAILGLNNVWRENKAKVDENFDLPKENSAIRKFLDSNFKGLLSVGVYVGDELIGYSIFSVLLNDYAICHFSKADISHYGVYEYLMKESCAILQSKKIKLLNYQEDLGLPGLRFFKNSFKPNKFLKKYFIKPF